MVDAIIFSSAVNELKPEWREAIARSQRSTYCLRLLTDSRASRCSVNSRRLDSKADSTCTALNVEAPSSTEAIDPSFSVPRRPFVCPIRDVGPGREDRHPPRC